MRLLLGAMACAAALPSAAVAQEPAKRGTFALELRGGETVLLKDAQKQGDQLCGEIFRKDAPHAPGCIPQADIVSISFADPKQLVLGGVRGGLCVVLAPVCLGVATKKIEAHVPQRIEKARAAKPAPS